MGRHCPELLQSINVRMVSKIRNSAQKGGFMRDAATEGIAILFPDTSPRGAGIEDEAATWDFGVGKSK